MDNEITAALETPPVLLGLEKVATSHDIPGAVAYEADVQYRSSRGKYQFIGSIFGAPGPVWLVVNTVMVEVVQPERFGVRFNDDWVRKFYA